MYQNPEEDSLIEDQNFETDYLETDDYNADESIDPEKYANQVVEKDGKYYKVSIDHNNDYFLEEVKIRYVCPESDCLKQFNHANSLTKHFKDVHNVKVFVCRQCPGMFQQLSDLFLHARRDHVDPKKPPKDPNKYKFHCNFSPDCNYMTNNGGTFAHHIRAHTGDKPFECDICHKRFTQNANMKTHRSRHVSEKLFSCEICKKSFKTHDIYLAHLRTREHELREHVTEKLGSVVKVVCLGCNERFTKLFDIRNHIRVCNQRLNKMFQCVSCDVLLEDFDELKKHIKDHKENMSISCPVCNAGGFEHYNQLNHHITRCHDIKVARKSVCRYCELIFNENSTLNEHIQEYHADEINSRKSHGNIGRFSCPYENCNFTANTELLIRSHINRHETGKLDLVKVSPKKRGRKRKIIDDSEILDSFRETSNQKIESTVKHEPIYSHEFVKKPRGRPRKTISLKDEIDVTPLVNSVPIVDRSYSNEEIDGTQLDYQNFAEAFLINENQINEEQKKRGRPRKNILNFGFPSQTKQDTDEQSELKSTVMFTPYIKDEEVLEKLDQDCLYV